MFDQAPPDEDDDLEVRRVARLRLLLADLYEVRAQAAALMATTEAAIAVHIAKIEGGTLRSVGAVGDE